MSTLAEGPRGLNHLLSHQGYQPNGIHHPAHPLSHHQTQTQAHQAQQAQQTDSPLSSSAMNSAAQSEGRQLRSSRRQQKAPDWGTFYKNGVPRATEIIVIDDSPEPPAPPPHSQIWVNGSRDAPPDTTAAGKKRKFDDTASQASYRNGPYTNGSSKQHSTSGSYQDRDTHAAPSANTSTDDSSYRPGPPKRKKIAKAQPTSIKRQDTRVMRGHDVEYKGLGKKPTKASTVSVRSIAASQKDMAVKIDDDDGHYIVIPDTELARQYRITNLLGQGTFGKVVKAFDRRAGEFVAVKVIRAVQKYRDAAKIELRALRTLRDHDADNRYRCIHLRDCFDFRGHICIVTDLLDLSLFDFLKGNSFVPFPNSHIQSFAKQLLTSVAFLHDLNLIHTDLKPENILLCDAAYQTYTYNKRIPSSQISTTRQAPGQRRVLLNSEIRLIDFGSATFQDEYHSSVVSTRHYRAPEIILGLGWSYPCDIWSIGCILVEFFTGDALFQTHDNLEHLAMIEAVLDTRIDSHLVRQVNQMANRSGSSNSASKYFRRGKLDYPTTETTRASRRFVKNMKRLVDIIPYETNSFFRNFLDLLQKIFVYDPARRISAIDALQHPWFKEIPDKDDGTAAAVIREERLASAARSEHG
ncbi:kinase-like domain-containing protein [Coniochaeta sp. 2T2.1]|nr:kinase-like domain-containing protein [Coniochaeta sp. 2T2.1]